MEPGDVVKPGQPTTTAAVREPDDLFTPLAPYESAAQPAPAVDTVDDPAGDSGEWRDRIAVAEHATFAVETPPPPPSPLVTETPAAPRKPLALVLRTSLAALSANDLATARAEEAAYLAQPGAPDEPSPTTSDLMRWKQTRELIGVSGELPPQLVRYLSTGISASDLGSIWPALGGFRQANPDAAGSAHAVLRDRAPMIFASIDGALWAAGGAFPARVQAYVPPPQNFEVRKSRSGAYGGLGVAGFVVFAVIRAVATMSHTSSYSSSYNYPDLSSYHYTPPPPIDFSSLNNLNTLDTYTPPATPTPPPVATKPAASDSVDDLESDILTSLRVLQRYDVASDAQVDAASTFEDYVLDEDCKKMTAGLPKLAASTKPASPDPKMVQDHLAVTKLRVKQMCAAKAKAAAKPKAVTQP